MKVKLSKGKDWIIKKFKEIQILGLFIGIFSSMIIMIILFWLINIRSWIGNTDANAWIQTVGTLFGSFAGAWLAGKYAIEVGNRQIKANLDEIRKENLNKLVKFNENYLLEVRSIRGICSKADKLLKDISKKYETIQKLQAYSTIIVNDTSTLKYSSDWNIVPALKYRDCLTPLILCIEMGSSIPIYLTNNEFDKNKMKERWTDHLNRLDPLINTIEVYANSVKSELIKMNQQ